MRLDHLLSKEQAESETMKLHPKVDCEGNFVRGKQQKLQKQQREISDKASATLRFNCRASACIVFRVPKARKLAMYLDNCTEILKDEK